jgi:hypothetical protein
METESDSLNAADERNERHQRRLKRYRALVFIALVGIICYGLLPRMAPVTKSVKSAAATLVASAPAQASGSDSLELSAFRLGKSVSDYSAMQLLGERRHPGDVHEANLTNARANIEARLANLRIAVDPQTLEFTWKPGFFDSPASGVLADALAEKYGGRIRALYLLGARLMSVRWRLAWLQDTVVWETSANPLAGASDPASGNTPDAMLTALNAMTSDVIGEVAPNEFPPPAAVEDLIRSQNTAADSLLLHLFSLDMAVETRLGPGVRSRNETVK